MSKRAASASVLVGPRWVSQAIDKHNVAVFDCSYYMPSEGRDCAAEFVEARIPTSIFFDIDAIASPSDKGLKHMMPSEEIFSDAMGTMGVTSDQPVVCYDSAGVWSSPRVWFTLQYVFGHRDVFVLDGGLPEWQKQGLEIESGPVKKRKKTVYQITKYDSSRVVSEEQVRGFDGVVIDARVPTRFSGEDEEPRPSLLKGHITGAVNIPHNELSGAVNVPLDHDVATYCGSGLSAAIVNLELHELGHRRHNLYDGSAAEFLNNQENAAFLKGKD